MGLSSLTPPQPAKTRLIRTSGAKTLAKLLISTSLVIILSFYAAFLQQQILYILKELGARNNPCPSRLYGSNSKSGPDRFQHKINFWPVNIDYLISVLTYVVLWYNFLHHILNILR
jgi:hypothetical protein